MDISSRLQPLDLAVIAAYIIALVGIGMWVSFRRRGAGDLFLAGRSLGWHNVGLSIFGTNVSPAFLISTFGIAYSTGMVAANFDWLAWWLLLLLAMVFVPHYLGTRISTMPEFMRRRFGPATQEFLAWYTLFTTLILWLGESLYVGGVLLGQIMDWPLLFSVVFLMVIGTSFTVAGGLAAVVITDSFQSILMILGMAILTLIALGEVGGVDALVERVPRNYWRLLLPGDHPDFPWYAMLLGYPVAGIWFWCTDQTIVQRVLGAKDIRHGQFGCVFAGFLKIIPPFIFMLPGIICYALHPNLENQDEAFMVMVSQYMPPGMVGLIVAVLIAAMISTVDSGLNSFSTVFTLDIYVKRFRPQARPQETKTLGRVVTLLVACLAVLLALWFGTLEKDLFNLFQGIIAFMAPPMSAVFLIAVIWKRATATAALSTLVLGSIVSIGIGVCHLQDWPAGSTGVLRLSGGETIEDYRKVLRTVSYSNRAEGPDRAARTVTFTASANDTVVRSETVLVTLDPGHRNPSPGADRYVHCTPGDDSVLIAAEAGLLEGLGSQTVDLVTMLITNLEDGSKEQLAADVSGTDIWAHYSGRFWPPYMLLSFYLFAGLCAFMVLLSLATKNSSSEEQLPSLKETYAAQGTQPKLIWVLWGVLAVIMLSIYLIFT